MFAVLTLLNPQNFTFLACLVHIAVFNGLMAYILARARARDCLRVVMEIQSRKYIDRWMDGLLAWIKYSKIVKIHPKNPQNCELPPRYEL